MYTMFQYYTDSSRLDQYRQEKMERAQVERELHRPRASHNRFSGLAARIFGLVTTTGSEPTATTPAATAI